MREPDYLVFGYPKLLYGLYLRYQGRSDGEGSIWVKTTQVNFLWGKNDVRTAIQHPKNIYTPQNKFLATPLLDIH